MNQSASNFLAHALKHAEGLAAGLCERSLADHRELILHPALPRLLVLHQRLPSSWAEEALAFREPWSRTLDPVSLSLPLDRISVAHSLAQQLLSMAEDSIQAWLLQGQVLLAAENRQAAARCFGAPGRRRAAQHRIRRQRVAGSAGRSSSIWETWRGAKPSPGERLS